MPVDFPTNIVILIVSAMIGAALITWFTLSEALKRVTLTPQVQRNWRWGTALVLGLWLLVRLAFAVNPPGGLAAEES